MIIIHNRSLGGASVVSFMVSVVNVSRVSRECLDSPSQGVRIWFVGARVDTHRDFLITIHGTALSRLLLNYYGPLHLSHTRRR